jgi:hypothetical protein
MINLDKSELREINGGSEYSYQVGKNLGSDLRQAVELVTLFYFFRRI